MGNLQNINWNKVFMIVAYKSLVILLFFITLILSSITGLHGFLLVHFFYAFICILLFCLPKRHIKFKQKLVYIIAFGNMLLFYPTLHDTFLYHPWYRKVIDTIICIIPISFFLYYDIKISLPKYN